MITKHERLSALVDAELTEHEIDRAIEDVTADPDLRESWARYQLIGTAIRRGVPDMHDPRLAERIAAAVAEVQPDDGIGIAVPAGVSPVRRTARLRHAAGGIAIAASVAAVALLGVRYLGPTVDQDASGMQVAGQSASTSQVLSVADPGAQDEVPLDRERLNDYLLRHNEFAANGGLRGLPPYVRVVSAPGSASVR